MRDRATIHLAELTQPEVPSFLTATWEVPPDHLQQALEKYMDEGDFSQPFNIVSPCLGTLPFLRALLEENF